MQPFETVNQMRQALEGILALQRDGTVAVRDAGAFRARLLDDLTATTVFAQDAAVREMARWLIREAALALDVVPASIQDFYVARGRGEVGTGFTVPAMNLRALVYDSARAALRATQALDVGAVVFELARSEIEYTQQDPAEYATVCMAAAVKEGWRGPLFIQGDHYQVRRARYARDPGGELGDLRALIRQALDAGVFNIDIDSSTLVDLARPTVPEQQEPNYLVTAELVEVVRRHEPRGVTVSIGGEIGEVGGHNTTPEELVAYVEGLRHLLREHNVAPGISKLSVQTGTRHGGIVLPDGSIAEAAVDFDTLEVLSRLGRERYGLAGAVQHGASTLPEEVFHRFPQVGTAEIHLATAFQNLVLDHPALTDEVRHEVAEYVHRERASDRQSDETDAQFLMRNRKFALGPLKRRMWELPEGVRDAIAATLEERFRFLYQQLGVAHTREAVARHVRPLPVHTPRPAGVG